MVTSLWINRLRELCSHLFYFLMNLSLQQWLEGQSCPLCFWNISGIISKPVFHIHRLHLKNNWLHKKTELNLCADTFEEFGKKGNLCVMLHNPYTESKKLKEKEANTAPGDFPPVNKEAFGLESGLRHPHKIRIKFLFLNIPAGSLNDAPAHDRSRPSEQSQRGPFLF